MFYKRIIDISLMLNAETSVYPGNPPVSIETFASASGTAFNSKITVGTHVGTHIDTPGHIDKTGMNIDDLSLNIFVGLCRVLDFTQVKHSISAADLKQKNIVRGERILLKTSNSQRGFKTFYDDYIFLSGEGAKYLADTGILLCGIDAFSVKQKGSADNTPHSELLTKIIPIIEGLNLAHVAEGTYTLIALPLKLETGDGAPARVILLE